MHKLTAKITTITCTILWFDVEVGDAALHTAVHRKQTFTMMSSLRKSHCFHANVHSIKSRKLFSIPMATNSRINVCTN